MLFKIRIYMLFALTDFMQLHAYLCINVITIYHEVFMGPICLKIITVTLIPGWKKTHSTASNTAQHTTFKKSLIFQGKLSV